MRMTGNRQPIWLQLADRSSLNFCLLREFQRIFVLETEICQ